MKKRQKKVTIKLSPELSKKLRAMDEPSPKKQAAERDKKIKRIKANVAKAKIAEVDPVFTDWKNRVSIAELTVRYTLTRSQVRRRLTVAAGGKAAFKALRQDGAGGVVHVSGRSGEATPRVVDDSKAKRVKSMKDWAVEHVYKGVIVKVQDLGNVPWREEVLTIYTSPKTGRRYVKARDSEPADLLHVGIGEGFPPGRLKRYEHSREAHKAEATIKEEAALLARGQTKLKKVRKAKREARKLRKLAKTGGR